MTDVVLLLVVAYLAGGLVESTNAMIRHDFPFDSRLDFVASIVTVGLITVFWGPVVVYYWISKE